MSLDLRKFINEEDATIPVFTMQDCTFKHTSMHIISYVTLISLNIWETTAEYPCKIRLMNQIRKIRKPS